MRGKRNKSLRALFFLICGTIPAFAGPYDGWAHYRTLTVNTTAAGANVATDQAGFPLLIRLTNTSASTGGDVLSGALSGGTDVRFTDSTGTAALPYQIERWTGSNAEIWVKVPTLSGNSSTSLRMYWGKSSQADASSGPAVFDTGNAFRAVWHMNGSSAASNEADATSDGYTATEQNSPGAQNTGGIGYSRTLNDFKVSPLSALGFNTSNAMSFADVNMGWAVGASGAILHTTDEGNTWTPQTSGTANNLNGVAFANASVGISVGAGGVILQTGNGGATWTTASSGTANDLNAVAFAPGRTDTALAVGAGGTIVKTTDGGVTWVALVNSNTNNLNAIAFNSLSHAVAIAVGAGGTTVKSTTVSSATTTWSATQAGTSDLNAIAYVPGMNIAYAVGVSGTIKKTTTGGSTGTIWSIVTSIIGAPTGNLTGIYCTEGNVGWIVGANGALYRTSLDTVTSGTKWALVASGTSQNLTAIQFLPNSGVGFVIGASNTLLKINYATGQYFTAIGTGGVALGTGINFDKFTNYTVSAWVNLDANDSTYHQVASKGDFQYTLQSDPAAKWEFNEFDDGTSGSFTTKGYNQALSSANAPTGWHYIAGVHNGSNASSLYLDGALVGSTITNTSSSSARVTTNDLDIGRSPDASAPFNRYWIGAIDELEISSASRSADWVRLSYQTQRTDSTFVS